MWIVRLLEVHAGADDPHVLVAVALDGRSGGLLQLFVDEHQVQLEQQAGGQGVALQLQL